MTITPLRASREADEVAGLGLGKDPLERHRRHVVTLVHDHLSVTGDEVVDASRAHQALDHGHVESPIGLALSAANLANVRFIEAKEYQKLRHPLIEDLPAVNQDEGTRGALGHEVRSNHCLSDAWGSDEDAGVVPQEGACRFFLDRSQLAMETQIQRFSEETLVLDGQDYPVLLILSSTGMNAWFGHSPHLTFGFSQTPGTHSLKQAGA